MQALEAKVITADEAALALAAAKGLGGLKTRDVGAKSLRQVTDAYGLTAVAQVLRR